MALEGFKWQPITQVLSESRPLEDPHAAEPACSADRGLWCAWQWACALSSSIQDAVVVAHGPAGCSASMMRFGVNRAPGFRHVVSTGMGTEQVVLGGEETLEEALKQADHDYRPALICVHTNCCSGLNMDDVAGVVQRVKDQVRARLFFASSPGFAACWPGDVARTYLPRYVELMDSPDKLERNAINILGVGGTHLPFGLPHRSSRKPDNLREMERMIGALGLKLHRALPGGGYDDLRTAPQAFANVYDCPTWGHPLGLAMQERFETLHLPHGQSVGVEATVRWVTDLAQATGTEVAAQRFINDEYAQIRGIWERAKGLAKGKTALISGAAEGGLDVGHPLARARFALELGMTPYLYDIHPSAIRSQDYVVEYFRGQGVDPVFLSGSYSYREFVEDIDVAGSLGLDPGDAVYMPGRRASFALQPFQEPWRWRDRADTPWLQPARDTGFAGAAELAEGLVAALSGPRRDRPTVHQRLFSSPPDGARQERQAALKPGRRSHSQGG